VEWVESRGAPRGHFIGWRGRARRWPVWARAWSRHGRDAVSGSLQWPRWPRRCWLVLQGGVVTSVARWHRRVMKGAMAR
jgi:hypothetical protein